MSDSQIRTSDLDKWSVITRLCWTLDSALTVAQEFLKQTQRITIWPTKQDQWLVIIQLPVMLN
jgi:uncharacterized membrane protein YjjP (DUF1212 family)